MKEQMYFVFGILIGVIMMITLMSFSPAYGAEYEDTDKIYKEGEQSNSMDFTYYKIELNNEKIYFCESYSIDGDMITIKNLFMEENTEVNYESMITSISNIKYIMKKRVKSKDEVKSECFIEITRVE